MEISTHIDWLAVTIPHNHPKKLPAFLHGIPFKESKPRYGYGVARTFVNGVVEFSMPFKESMGTHIIYSGKALDNIRVTLENEHDPLNYHYFYGHSITRIDYACDMQGDGIPKLLPLIEAFKDETVDTQVRSRPKVISSGIDQHETMYIGSMKKRKKLLRIYRKDIQLGDYSTEWLRAELECRGDTANNSVKEYYGSTGNQHDTIRALICGYCDFPSYDAWSNAMGSKATGIAVKEHKSGNTKKWLVESVAPALAKEIRKDHRVWEAFLDAVNSNLDELDKSLESDIE